MNILEEFWYSGLIMSTADSSRSTYIFRFKPGKTKRMLGDELQPRDEDKKRLFVHIPQKYIGLYVSIGILVSYVLTETL